MTRGRRFPSSALAYALLAGSLPLHPASAFARVSLEGSFGAFFSELTATDSFSATGTLASKLSYQLGTKFVVGSPTAWDVALLGSFRFHLFEAPLNATLDPDRLSQVALGVSLVRHLKAADLSLDFTYSERPLLILAGSSELELGSAFVPAVGLGATTALVGWSPIRFGLLAGGAYSLGSSSGPGLRVDGGWMYRGGIQIGLGVSGVTALRGIVSRHTLRHENNSVITAQQSTELLVEVSIRTR